MYPRFRRMLGIAAVAAVVAPAPAIAHDRASVRSVEAHVRSADRALDRVVANVGADHRAAAAVAFARNRAQTARAKREAARVAARTPTRGAAALRSLAHQHDANADAYVGLVEQATGDLQLMVAKAAAASLKNRDLALAELASLAEALPAAARAAIAELIAALTADDEAGIATLGDALSLPTLPVDVRPWIELAIAQATTGLQMAIAQIESIVPTLPAAAQPHVQMALGLVSGVMEQVTGILQGLFGGPAGEQDGQAGAPPAPGGLPLLSDLLSKLPIPGRG